MAQLKKVAHIYRQNSIKIASPIEQLLMTYDAAINACVQQNLQRFSQVISILRNALDFDRAPDVAINFFRIYQYCEELARQGKFEQAEHTIRELRTSWEKANSTK